MMHAIAVRIVVWWYGLQAVVGRGIKRGDKMFRLVRFVKPSQDVIKGPVFEHEVDDVVYVFHDDLVLLRTGSPG